MGIRAPAGYTIHHRKRQEDGGDDSDGNISFVLPSHHQAWNILFDRYSNDRIALCLEKYWSRFGAGKAMLMAREIVLNLLESQERKRNKKLFPAKGLRQIRELTHIGKSEAKKLCAWILLFDNLSLESIVKIINGTWLNPEFEFVVKPGTARILIRKRK